MRDLFERTVSRKNCIIKTTGKKDEKKITMTKICLKDPNWNGEIGDEKLEQNKKFKAILNKNTKSKI